MNEINLIEKQEVLGRNFRIYGTIEEPLFLAKDVAEWIEHSRASEMLKTIDEDEKLMQTILASGQNREMWFLTENGLYEVLMQSRKPIAKAFKKEVKKILKSIRKTGTYTTQQATVSLKEQVEITNFIANSLNLNEASKIVMFRKVYEDNNVPCSFLPDYIQGNNKELRSATELLDKFNLGMNIRKLNSLLVEKGYLEEKSRASKNTKSGIKKYKILTEKGLVFGENMVSPHNQKEVQPLYYVDRFLELFKLVV